jgi:hypothetical protein
MSNIDLIINKVKKFARHQQLINVSAYLIFTFSTILISISIALFLLKSPLYGIIGIIPLFFFRFISFIERARTLEKRLGLNGELINSIQLSYIPKQSKERYSQELINAYVDGVAAKIKNIDFKKYISHNILHNTLQFLLISIAFALIHPAILPDHFWYSLNHKIDYFTEPGDGEYLKGSEIEIALHITGVYTPTRADLIISSRDKVVKDKIVIQNGIARKKIKLDESITYQFKFLDHETNEFTLVKLEPIYIEALSFHLKYPPYTKLKEETKTGRQIIAPQGTRIFMQGMASQPVKSAQFLSTDTLNLTCKNNTFTGEFVVIESGTAILYLKSFTELKEQIIIYAVPDLAPLIDIFFPGYNINLPSDMEIDVGIKCSDDYGLSRAKFYYEFEEENTKNLVLKKGAIEDTIYFKWDLSDLGMLPGDEVSYFAEITDNAGNINTSRRYYIYFPTMEEIYDEISKKEELIQKDLEELQTEHTDESEKIARIHQKLMKERKLVWADQEKLREAITKEKEILNKIDEWQTELERTIEKLNQGIILDQESIERLQEISKILQEIAPDELKQALENLQLALDKTPRDMQKALDELKQSQKDLAKALERTLEILKRFQQEEQLKELAQMAKDLALKADDIEKLAEQDKNLNLDKDIAELNKGIDELIKGLEELAESEGLEQEIKEALEQIAQQMSEISEYSSATLKDKKKGLKLTAADLKNLYESFIKGRVASLRKNLLEILNQLIDISKAEENLYKQNQETDIEQQDQIIEATKVIADSLYAQQIKSLYVTPHMGKNLARAISHMNKAKQKNIDKQNAQEAMRSINLVCLEILRNMQSMAEGGSSTGMDEFLEGLSKISKGQMSITQSLSAFLPIPVSGLSGEQKAQLQKLAGKQRALREALESLRGEAGATKYQDLLDHIASEMKKSEEALYQYKLDRKLIERQKKIISRLLDAQKSIRKEDYEKRRKSKPGMDFLVRESPKTLPEDLGEDELRVLIQKALRESYPKEYELYIREYFKSLLEEK